MIPDDVKYFCNDYKLCKGCPMGSCSDAPNVNYDSPKWTTYIDNWVKKVRKYKESIK